MATTQRQIAIIGAGTGGLALAHGLLRDGFDVAVYERDRTRSDGLYGYRVGISPDGSRALHALLPADLFATFVATTARQTKSLTFLDEKMTVLLSIGEADGLETGGDNPIESEKSVSRMTLRQVLLTGLGDVVEFDKTFTHYEVRQDGKVEAFFDDGSSVVAALLVGADGSNSRVRGQLLPHARLLDTGIVGVTGKVALTDGVRKLLTPELVNGVALVFAPKGYSLVSHTMEFRWDKNGPKEGIGRTEAALIEKWPGLLFDNTSDYFMWGFAGSKKRLPMDLMPFRGAELIERVLALTSPWHPNLRHLIGSADPSATFPLSIRSSVPVEPWATGPVTLMGDAIHTMTPGRGVGANTALLDALLLHHHLVDARAGSISQRECVAAYERSMIQYGFEAVRESLKQMTADEPIHHSLWGGLALAGMRGAFKVMNRLPAARRRMAQSETSLRKRKRHPALGVLAV